MSLIGFNAVPSTDGYPKSSWQIQRAMLSGNRLHLQHGPINLVIKANGDSSSIKKAYELASHRMEGMLQGLVDNLSTLRVPLNPRVELSIDDVTSNHMISTARQFEDHFITNKELNIKQKKYPLVLYLCKSCKYSRGIDSSPLRFRLIIRLIQLSISVFT